MVIYVVLRYSKMQTVTYIYILMLALADEIFLIGIPFLIVTSVQGDWIFGMAMCKIYLTTTSINQFTSSIFLTVLSADRYIAVCHPISAPKYRTSIIARCVSLTAWAASALLMVSCSSCFWRMLKGSCLFYRFVIYQSSRIGPITYVQKICLKLKFYSQQVIKTIGLINVVILEFASL